MKQHHCALVETVVSTYVIQAHSAEEAKEKASELYLNAEQSNGHEATDWEILDPYTLSERQ